MSNPLTIKLLSWFDQHGRKDLPWQKPISPYRVWISEIMLQQTQVATVIPYFQRFMHHFPNVVSLANSDLDSVFHLWTGLGYYARARNLHQAAKIIVAKHNNTIPEDLETLIALPGIGRSTAGAILSIAFQKPCPILDGNVKRVLCRYLALSGYPGEKTVEKNLWKIASEFTPTTRCRDYTQAIMDLGALICTRNKPKCSQCPLSSTCIAFKQNLTDRLPEPKPRTALPLKHTQFLIMQNQKGQILLEKRPLKGIWGGLWSFPEYAEKNINLHVHKQYKCNIGSIRKGESIRHSFTHFHLEIVPIFIDVRTFLPSATHQELAWVSPLHLQTLGLPAPVKKVLSRIFNFDKNT